MCRVFSCIAHKTRGILVSSDPAQHSHTAIIKEHGLIENSSQYNRHFVRIEVTPSNNAGYFNSPDSCWTAREDETGSLPGWYSEDKQEFRDAALAAAQSWWTKNVGKDAAVIWARPEKCVGKGAGLRLTTIEKNRNTFLSNYSVRKIYNPKTKQYAIVVYNGTRGKSVVFTSMKTLTRAHPLLATQEIRGYLPRNTRVVRLRAQPRTVKAFERMAKVCKEEFSTY